jgi:hypothetical protein
MYLKFLVTICFQDWKREVKKTEDDSKQRPFSQPTIFKCDQISTSQKSVFEVQRSDEKSVEKLEREKSNEKSIEGFVPFSEVVFHSTNYCRGGKREFVVCCLPDALSFEVILPGFSFYPD